MYACSPGWQADWIFEEEAEAILSQLARRIRGSPYGKDRVGVNDGLHFTGGEPFLNFDLLLKLTRVADRLKISSSFVETNCFWCTDDERTAEKILQLREAGLKGMLISVNPFILEEVPFERTERAVRIGKRLFGENLIVYQEFFFHQMKGLKMERNLSSEEYIEKAGVQSLCRIELLPIGRCPYQLRYLYKKLPARAFFGESCREELTRPWHVHIDNYFNYIAGYCGGISLGDARNFDSIWQGIDMDDHPILEALTTDLKGLYQLGVDEWGYKERQEGYISKCHLCVDIRKHLATQTNRFKELRPIEFYDHLESLGGSSGHLDGNRSEDSE